VAPATTIANAGKIIKRNDTGTLLGETQASRSPGRSAAYPGGMPSRNVGVPGGSGTAADVVPLTVVL
jgi:hypothetical protein